MQKVGYIMAFFFIHALLNSLKVQNSYTTEYEFPPKRMCNSITKGGSVI